MLSEGALRLKSYLDAFGILLCNETPLMRSLTTIGCVWTDVTELIDQHALFYCRAYRKRSTYLSPEVYFLLRQCKGRRPLTEQAGRLIQPLEGGAVLEADALKKLTLLEGKDFAKAQQFLLENLYITAFQNGRVINPTWSTFRFSTVETWEKAVPLPAKEADAREKLEDILARSMSLPDVMRFIQ